MNGSNEKYFQGRKSTWVVIPAILVLLSIFVLQCLLFIRNNSVTVDEYVHVPVGLSYIRHGVYELDHEGNPPFTRRLLALPLAGSDFDPDFSIPRNRRDRYRVGWLFMVDNFKNYHNRFVYPRLINVAAGIVLVLILWIAAARMYGFAAAVAAAALAVFSPNLIAHSSLATLDLSATVSFFGASIAFLLYLRRPGWHTAIAAGLTAGIAMLTKYTNAIIVPVFFLMAIADFSWTRVSSEADRNRAPGNVGIFARAAHILIMGLAALLVINADYGFSGSFMPLGELNFRSAFFSNIAASVPDLPLLLPKWYLEGIDSQLFMKDFQYHAYFMMGKTSGSGWSSYFILNWLLKETGGAVLLVVLTTVGFIFARPRKTEFLLAIPPLCIFLFFSFVARVDLGFRYILPAIPFIYLLIARNFSSSIPKPAYVVPAAVILVAWHAVSSLLAAPYNLAYFNVFAGGPDRGSRYFLESNYDWGQNLIALKNYVKMEEPGKIYVYNYGLVPPQAYGVDAEWLPCRPDKGTIAISPNYVYGINPFEDRPEDCFENLRGREPDARVGHSLFIYHLYGAGAPASDKGNHSPIK